MKTKKVNIFLFVLVLCFQFSILCTSISYAWPFGPFDTETVSGHIDANNNFAWDYNYGVGVQNNSLNIHVEIDFNLLAGVTQEELDTLKTVWENGIEDTWNNKYFILKDNTYHVPINFDVTYDGPFNYTVDVREGPATSNMTTWDTEDTGLVAAHEFGHMLGLFDEYDGGATNPAEEIIDSGSIMGSTAQGAVPRERHFQGFLAWLSDKDPDESFKLKPVPEPATLLLLATGLGGIFGIRRKFR